MATPLADRIRPQSIEDMIGQKHLIGENMPLRNKQNPRLAAMLLSLECHCEG